MESQCLLNVLLHQVLFNSFDFKMFLQAQLLREHLNNIFQKLQYGRENKPASNEIRNQKI